MKLIEKIPQAKKAIEFIARHDDAELEHVEAALDELVKFIKDEKKKAAQRRAEKKAGEA